MDILGVHFVGLTGENGRKLLFTLAVLLVVLLVRAAIVGITRRVSRGAEASYRGERVGFWVRQGASIAALVVLVLAIISIWFDDPSRLTTFLGLLSAGVAVALQRVVTSFAAYLIILRGRVFTVGDRITMGGVRGDVVALGFMQTSVLEMGEPPEVQDAEPAVWVNARQYTGRLVRVTNDKIFDSPVWNYTREFPFLWEEIRLPVRYGDDRDRVERILLEAAAKHTAKIVAEATPALESLRDKYFVPGAATLEPRTFYRLTDNWLELTVRFVVPEHGVREIKNAMSRDILAALDQAGIGIASGTYEIVGLPPVRVRVEDARAE